VHVIVRNVGHVGRVGACMLCPCGSEQREHGVGAGVNATMLSETLPFTSLVEYAARAFRLRKKTMNLCACDSEEREHGVGASVNGTMLSETLAVIRKPRRICHTLFFP
jgi:hypothetical protein